MSEEAKPAKGKFLLIAGAGGGLVAILLFGALFSYVMSSDEYGPDRQLDLAVKLLDEGRWDLADRIARDIEKGGDLTPARESVWNYVRGVAGCWLPRMHWIHPPIDGDFGILLHSWKKVAMQNGRWDIEAKEHTISASVITTHTIGTRLSKHFQKFLTVGLSVVVMR